MMWYHDQISGGTRRLVGAGNVAKTEERIMSARVYARVLVALLAGGVLLTATTQAQTTWYVDDDADPNGDGLTWFTAFDDLQDALGQAVAGDEIRVAGGTYGTVCP